MYRLEELAKLAVELGFSIAQASACRVDVVLAPGIVLSFNNMVEENDTLLGFVDSCWHTHGRLLLSSGENTNISCDEFDVLVGLAAGEMLVVGQYVHGELRDRWICHKGEPLELADMVTGEELRVVRLGSV
jgi:hypothetical protein